MSAAITREPVAVEVIRWQVDRLGYTLCADHACTSRGGDSYEREPRDVLREADADGLTDPYVAEVTAALWTCDACRRHVTTWPRATVTMWATIEHTSARIF